MKEREYIVTGVGLVDSETGELIDPKDYIKENLDCARDSIFNANQAASKYDINFRVRILRQRDRAYLVTNVKKDFDFQKIMQVSVQALFDNKMSIYSKAFIGQFTPFLYFPDNYVKVGKNFPSIEEYSKLMGVGKNKIYEVLNELEKFEVVKRGKGGQGILVYFNPYLYSVGLVDMDTVKMFAGSIYNIRES
jgi:hypothetical protein